MSPLADNLGSIDPQPEGGNFSMPIRMLFVALAMAAVLAVEFQWPGLLRGLLVLAFLCTVPGAAAMSFAPRLEPLAVAALTVAVSLALSTTIALVAVLTRTYEPDLMMLFTAALSIVLLFWGPRASEATHITEQGRHYREDSDDEASNTNNESSKEEAAT